MMASLRSKIKICERKTNVIQFTVNKWEKTTETQRQKAKGRQHNKYTKGSFEEIETGEMRQLKPT